MHRSCTIPKRIFACLGTLTFLTLMLFILISAALVRSSESFANLLVAYEDPLMILSDIHSILLITMGFVISIFAVHKGVVSFSDPIPAYSSLGFKIEEIEDEIIDVKESLAEELTEIFESFQNEVEGISAELDKNFTRIAEKITQFNFQEESLIVKYELNFTRFTKSLEGYRQDFNSLRNHDSSLNESFINLKLNDFPELQPSKIGRLDLATMKQSYQNTGLELRTIEESIMEDLHDAKN